MTSTGLKARHVGNQRTYSALIIDGPVPNAGTSRRATAPVADPNHSSKSQRTVFGLEAMIVPTGLMTLKVLSGDVIVKSRTTATESARPRVGQLIDVSDRLATRIVTPHRIVNVNHGGAIVADLTIHDAYNAPGTTPQPSSDAIGVSRTANSSDDHVFKQLGSDGRSRRRSPHSSARSVIRVGPKDWRIVEPQIGVDAVGSQGDAL